MGRNKVKDMEYMQDSKEDWLNKVFRWWGIAKENIKYLYIIGIFTAIIINEVIKISPKTLWRYKTNVIYLKQMFPISFLEIY